MPPEAGEPAIEACECSTCVCVSHPSILLLPHHYVSDVEQRHVQYTMTIVHLPTAKKEYILFHCAMHGTI